MRLTDIMSTDLVTLMPGHSVRHAARVMLQYRVSGVPVVEGEAVVGILTEGDLLRRVELGSEGTVARYHISPAGVARDFVRTHSWRVGDVMSKPVIAVDETTPLVEAALLLSTRGIKRVPVLRGSALVGILSRTDLLKVVAEATSEHDNVAQGAEALRRAAQTRLDESGLFASPLTATVEEHIVHIWGVVRSSAERDAARVCVETIPGVAGTDDHLKIGW